MWELLTELGDSRLVTVAVVEGRAVGGGVGLAAACDFVFAGPEAAFRLTELLFGLVPALVMPFVVARTGEHRMLRMAVLAEPYDASAARARSGWPTTPSARGRRYGGCSSRCGGCRAPRRSASSRPAAAG